MSDRKRFPVSRRELVAIALVILIAAMLRCWRLDQNGFGNTYYSAAVRSMLQSWHNFFFVSFDPAGFGSVDKPPVALWLQAVSAKLFGFHGVSLLLPQVAAGAAGCGLLWWMVRRDFGPVAGVVAGVVAATTPISVAVDRTNNMDSILFLFLLLAADAVLRAARTGGLRTLLMAAFLLGVAFNTKMLAAFVVLPAFALAYGLGCSLPWKRRIGNLAAAGLVLAVVSLSWAAVVDLTPKSSRPFVGSSSSNSALSLVFGYNGVSRLTGAGRAGAPMGMPPMGGMPMMGMGPGGPGGPMGGMAVAFGGRSGPMRLAQTGLADQVTWLYPLAGAGMLAALVRFVGRRRVGSQGGQVLLWSLWLGAYTAVYSFARGIMHPYYFATLTPAVAALSGIAVALLTENWGDRPSPVWALPAALILTATWETRILRDYESWGRFLAPNLLIGTLTAVIVLIITHVPAATESGAEPLTGDNQLGTRSVAVALGILALLISPGAWSATAALGRVNPVIPTAGPSLVDGKGSPMDFMMGPMGGGSGDHTKLIAFLRAHRARERYLLIVGDLQTAASIVIDSGEPVVALGGFVGTDPILTPERLGELVRSGQARYVMSGGMGMLRGPNSEVLRWARLHGKPVPDAEWRSDARGGMAAFGPMGDGKLYDCATKAAPRETAHNVLNNNE